MMELNEPTEVERFLAFADVRGPDQCWWWSGPVRPDRPFVAMWRRGSPIGADRFAWEQLAGNPPIPRGAQFERTEHDNSDCPGGTLCPHTLCVNPNHLRYTAPNERRT